MATQTGFRIEGQRKMIAQLNALDYKLRRKYMTKAIRQAAKPVVKKARATAPVETPKWYESKKGMPSGSLKKSIGVKVKSYKKSMTHMGIIGSYVTGSKAVTYGHLVEAGTQRRYRFNPKIFGKEYGVEDVTQDINAIVLKPRGKKRAKAGKRGDAEKRRAKNRRKVFALLSSRSDRDSRATGRTPKTSFFRKAWISTSPKMKQILIHHLRVQIQSGA